MGDGTGRVLEQQGCPTPAAPAARASSVSTKNPEGKPSPELLIWVLDITEPGGSLEVLVVPTPVHCPHAVPKEEGQTLRQGTAEPVLPHLRSVPKFLPSAHPPGPGSCAGAAALLRVREVPGAGVGDMGTPPAPPARSQLGLWLPKLQDEALL